MRKYVLVLMPLLALFFISTAVIAARRPAVTDTCSLQRCLVYQSYCWECLGGCGNGSDCDLTVIGNITFCRCGGVLPTGCTGAWEGGAGGVGLNCYEDRCSVFLDCEENPDLPGIPFHCLPACTCQ